MGNVIICVQFKHLGVDQNEPTFTRTQTKEQRHDDRVEAGRQLVAYDKQVWEPS